MCHIIYTTNILAHLDLCALNSHSFHLISLFLSIQFNCLFLVAVTVAVVVLSYSFFVSEGKIYGKSERFIGFWGNRSVYNFCFHFVLFFFSIPCSMCFGICLILFSSLLFFCLLFFGVCVNACVRLLSLENLLLFYYHFDKVADSFSVFLLFVHSFFSSFTYK